jgi:hypothetical protein
MIFKRRRESIWFRRPSGHNEAVTPDVSALFQLWSFLFARKPI